jgi:hypothetical protein
VSATETEVIRVKGEAWLNELEESGTYTIDGALCDVEIERTDTNEVRLGVKLGHSQVDNAMLYFTDGEALRLMAALGKAVLS